MFRDGKYGREHNKHDFDADYNNFVLTQDKLTILANYEQAHGGIDTLLSYLDDNVVGSAIKDACNDKRYLSKAIENAYLVESFKAKLDGNKFFDEVAHSVYDKFEGKITPAEFVGSSAYVGCFSGEHLSATLNDKISERDYEAGRFLDTDELPEDDVPDEVYNLADTYYIGDYELESYSRESHIDLSDYAEKLNQFVIDKRFGKYVGNTVKSRLRSVLDYSFHEALCQAGSRVYFNRSLSGGNLEHLHDFVNYLIDNKSSFDKIAGDHVVDEVMRDKLADVAKDVSALSCDGILKNEEGATVICGVALEQFYRDRVGKFAGTRVIQSFVDNDKIKEGGKSKFYRALQDNVSFDKKHLVDLVSAFNDFDSDVKDFSDNLDIKAKSETKRKVLNVSFDVDADKQSTDDDDFDK